MLRVRVVIGPHNARKSSTIRALTGVGKVPHPRTNFPSSAVPPVWEVSYRNVGAVQTFVYPNGLQEVGFTSASFIRKVKASGVAEIIVALRYSHRVHGDATDYLKAFQEAGWDIVGHAVLGDLAPLAGFAGGILVPDAAQMPSNSIAARLRKAWDNI